MSDKKKRSGATLAGMRQVQFLLSLDLSIDHIMTILKADKIKNSIKISSFIIILKKKQLHRKGLLKGFLLNGQPVRFHPQTEKLKQYNDTWLYV